MVGGAGGGYQSMRSQKLLSTESKKNVGIFKKISSTNNNTFIRATATINSNRFSYNVNDKIIKEALTKIMKKQTGKNDNIISLINNALKGVDSTKNEKNIIIDK